MKGYKGFEKGLICKDKHYAENTVFEEEKAVPCECGMHFCENPFDVLDYYDLVNGDGSFNEFADVESLAEAKTDDKKKFCTTKLKVGAKLSFAGFIKVCVDFVIKKTSFPADKLSENEEAQIGSSGDYAKIDSTGEDSVICCAGHGSCVKAKKAAGLRLQSGKIQRRKKDMCRNA